MTARHSRLGLSVALALAVLAWATTPASALQTTTYSLSSNITNNGNAYVGGQLFVDVNEVSAGANQVDFTFRNTGPIASSITDVYFDDGSLLSISSITGTSGGVAFSAPASPPVLPGGASIDFAKPATYSADSTTPVEANGVNPGEYLTIRFNLQGVQTYSDVISAITLALTDPTHDLTGGLRFGVHVQAIGTTGNSDSDVTGGPTGGPVVPEPSTMAIAGLGALGFIGYGLRRRRSK